MTTIEATRSSYDGPSYGPTYIVRVKGKLIYRGRNIEIATKIYKKNGGQNEQEIESAIREAESIHRDYV